ncbi:hypothetical protein RGAI101_2096 [Roseobacter sp. GAI101]|nr:hypothetical protein RGAI101_2096 [Roseobacter sp. GAI101]
MLRAQIFADVSRVDNGWVRSSYLAKNQPHRSKAAKTGYPDRWRDGLLCKIPKSFVLNRCKHNEIDLSLKIFNPAQ